MTDGYGRKIEYLRVSVTDRCNLHCVYCMPPGAPCFVPERELLTADEIVRVCACAARMGIRAVRLTGGEPLLRADIEQLLARISALEGIERVALTTNGTALSRRAQALKAAGLHAVNVSLDSLNPDRYRRITGVDALQQTMEGIQAALAIGLQTKINCVCLPGIEQEAADFVRLTQKQPLSVRFIELMPVGIGRNFSSASLAVVRHIIQQQCGTLLPCDTVGNGPARYERLAGFCGTVGWIAACSAPFCARCNRIRLTSTGRLRTCLGHDQATDLKAILRRGASDEDLMRALQIAVAQKPQSGAFDRPDAQQTMNTIGG